MKQVHILYFNFLSRDGRFDIGGIETYIQLLAIALNEQYHVRIYFLANEDFIIENETFRAHGIACNGIHELQRVVAKRYAGPEDTIIFATEQITPVIRHPRIVGIQHGIYWDLPAGIYRKYTNKCLLQALKIFDNYRNYFRSGKVRLLVCVDYNFLNWKRTLARELDENRYKVILNCASDRFFDLRPVTSIDRPVTILFPRRFVKLRGCMMFVNVARQLLQKNDHFRVIISGDGPLEKEMKTILPEGKQVRYTSVTYEQMPELFSECDIVAIPSLGSEGSSLAVIEGMAAGRIVIASNTGGINNLIIHGFNGLLCSPSHSSFLHTLDKVISDSSKYRFLAGNARLTAESAFRFRNWAKAWQDCIAELYDG